MESKNLWILTEERPKNEVVGEIIGKFAKDYNVACFINNIRILPILINLHIYLSFFKNHNILMYLI
jgi:hypothetical protein